MRMSTDPARVFRLPGGSLSPGAPGDVTIIDTERELTVEPARFHSRSRNTPFTGWKLRGAPVTTIVGGAIVSEEGSAPHPGPAGASTAASGTSAGQRRAAAKPAPGRKSAR